MKGRTLRFLLVFAALVALATAASAQPDATLLLRTPTVSEEHVAFVYAGDIWIANRDGSQPRRLTVHEGQESDPYFSPDGKWIAFSGQYDGNVDVYAVSVDGGAPIRLTWHPESNYVRGWSPDSENVLFRSVRSNETYRYGRIYQVPAEGGFPDPLILPRVEELSYSPEGDRIAYSVLRDAFSTWKRYRGGRRGPIWIFDVVTHDVREIPYAESNDTSPVWLGDKVYFLSDRNYIMNVFAWDPKTNEVTQVTQHDDYDVRSLTGNAGVLTYEQAGRVHVLDPAAGGSEALPIRINPDLPDTRPHFVNASSSIRSFNLSPTGVRAVFGARGEIFTVPAEKGNTRNLTRTPGAHERYPVWAPGGNRIAFFSDESGEYKLHLIDQKGREEARVLDPGEGGFFYHPVWSPDGERIAYRDRGVSLFVMNVDEDEAKRIARSGQEQDDFMEAWSPDGRWLAYTMPLDNYYRAIFVYDTETGNTHQVTDGMSDAVAPTFSRDGRHLYFAASTNFGLNVSGLDMSSYERPVRHNLYTVVLREDDPSFFVPESDEEEIKEGDEEKADETEKESGTTVIDFEGIQQRILALDVPEGHFMNLAAAGGYLFYVEDETGQGDFALHRYDPKEEKDETFLPGVAAYEISADGKKLLYGAKGTYGIVDVTGNPSMGDGKLDVSGMEVKIDPRAEWAQMFREAWRLERDFFYDPHMHGTDWDAVYDKYDHFVQHAGHRSDLNYLIGEMIGELVVGHAYRGGGDYPDVESVDVGMLGADFVVEDAYYRIERIFSGLNWNPDLTAPLTLPGVNVHEGDYILAVNGKTLRSDTNIYALFENTTGKQTTITVNDEPTTRGARVETVVPVSDEQGLRLMAWVEENRRKVEEATDGRVGYVYLPNTGGAGYEFFNRYYFSQLDKHGMIIDERFNGGGSVADYMIDMMSRPLINWWVTRDETFYASPHASHYGPKVMIVNQDAGSGGDWLPMAFKKRGLGTVVGKTTWGGLVGIEAMPPLMDGGYVTSPSFAILSPEGEWIVENEGVTPDIVVEQTPKEVIAGGDPQLEKAIEVIKQDLKDYDPPMPYHEPYPNRAGQGKPDAE